MRMSTKAQYAVRALVSLNLDNGGLPISIKVISERENISLNYLEQLFVKLRRGGIVNSIRGPGGGYVLARPAADIRMDQIVDTVEEAMMPLSCMNTDGSCGCGTACATQLVWHGLGQQIKNFLTSITLEELTNDCRRQLKNQVVNS
ncbi:MAG: Rrf2 family transcriptional regulator [Desulfuromonadales bacterium]|nr:Rrf2 family transcriptional regulator [Desulfuromonadales bacterium]